MGLNKKVPMLLTLIIIQLAKGLKLDVDCLSEGECQYGSEVGNHDEENVDDCLAFCQGIEACNFFTYDSTSKLCVTFESCPNLSTEFCPQCVTGDSDVCDSCFNLGHCLGPVITSRKAESKEACLKACQDIPTCQYFSFYSDDNACILTTGCDFVDETCGDVCVYGNRNCHADIVEDPTLVLVIGGRRLPHDAEILDFRDGDQTTCLKPADLPERIEFSFGTQVSSQVLVCGGTYTQNCYAYDFELKEWNIVWTFEDKVYAGADLMIDADTWWVTGVRLGDKDNATLIYKDGKFTEGPETPFTSGHCGVKLNETHYFFAGGGDLFRSSSTYIYDFPSDVWTRQEDMHIGYSSHACGKTGDLIVAVVGTTFQEDITEIFSLADLTWHEGPRIPFGLISWNNMGSVYQYNGTFAIIGGNKDGDFPMYTVYEFDVDDLDWIERPERLKTARSVHVNIPMDRSLAGC